MKKFIFIFFILAISTSLFSQYQVIFTDPQARDLGGLVSFTNIHDENSSVYIFIAGNWFTFRSPYWVRYYKSFNRFDSIPHYGYLRGGFCFSTWGWGTTGIGNFIVSNIDTNLILGLYSEGPCGSPEGYSYNLISYNSGQNSSNPLQTQNGVMGRFDIDPSNDSLIYGAGSNIYEPPKFWKSTNKGNTWNGAKFRANAQILAVRVNPLAVNEIYCLTGDTIYKSTDYGDNYAAISISPGNVRLFYIDNIDGTLYLTSYNGLYKSTNGGYDFTLKNNYNCNVLLVDPDNHNILYLGVHYEGLYKSTNAGNNWRKYFDAFDSSFSLTGVIKYKKDGDTIYASNNHRVYKIWNELVRINNTSAELSERYSLSQNYPNPFNPVTKISYTIPQNTRHEKQKVNIVLYEITGREVLTLVNEKSKSPGSYEVEFDGRNFPSGVYFYSLVVDESVIDTKRMMLLK